MRLSRPVAAAAGSLALASALTGATALASAAMSAAASPPAVLISPDAVHIGGGLRGAPATAYCEQHYHIACYLPGQIQQAYNLPALYRTGITGKGQTIVIVDSYGSPTVRHDLVVFDAAAHLPAPPSLKIIRPAG